jgi:hypothetical protein
LIAVAHIKVFLVMLLVQKLRAQQPLFLHSYDIIL